ncbi:MAG: hypothetical protein Q9M13_02955 [Mariprofundales bacterium]|nr:hypothetical protein [Mariprofundales bacterium]
MRTMIHQSLATALMVVVISLLAPGCGGSSSSSVTPVSSTTAVVTGVANLGVVRDGVVNAYRLDGGSRGVLLDSYAATDIYGQYQLRITNYQGPMLLELTQNGNGSTQFLDEYSGTMKVLGTTMRSVVPTVTADKYANITALTEIASLAALQKMSRAGSDPAQSVMEALAQVGVAFLAGDDPLTLRPDDVSQDSYTDSNSSHYASVLAGFSGLAAQNGTTIAQLAADFYGQMFLQVGSPYGQASPYTDALYTKMQAVTTNAVVKRLPVAKAKPLGIADIVAAHQGQFDFMRLTLSSVNGSDDLSVGVVDFYASVASSLLSTVTENMAYRNGVATTVAGVVNYYGRAQEAGSWELRSSAVAQSGTLYQQGVMAGGGELIAGVTTDIYNVASHNLLLAVKRPATAVAASSMVGDWQWVAVEQSGGQSVTWSGELTITSSTGYVGGVTLSNQTAAGRQSISGTVGVDSYTGFLLTNTGLANAFMPTTIHLTPTADANKAVLYFADGTNWGVGVALRRNQVVQSLAGRLYHYVALNMVDKISTTGMVDLVKKSLVGREFTSATQRPVTTTQSFTLTWPTASSNGAQPITVVQAGQSLSGYVASDGSVMVLEDPGKGLRLLLRQ